MPYLEKIGKIIRRKQKKMSKIHNLFLIVFILRIIIQLG